MIREPQKLTAVLSTPHLTAQLRPGPRLRATLGEGIPVAGPPGLPRVIYDEGNPLPVRTIINMVGAGVTAADDGANDQTVITIPGDAVSSVFTRTGAIVATAGDYTAAQVTNAVSVLGSYPDPAWITSLDWDKISGEPSAFPPSAHSHDWADITGEPSSFPPSVHVHAAADVTSGVFAVARLGTGTPTASVYLRGDGQWASVPIPADAVTSVFGRAGVVVAQSGDYAVAQVTGAVPDTRQVIAGTGLSGGGALSGDVTLSANKAAIQTPWLQNVSAAGFALTNAPLFQSGADMVFSVGAATPERMRIRADGVVRCQSHMEAVQDRAYCGNLTFDGSNWRYIGNGSGFYLYAAGSGDTVMVTAPGGTAGAVAAFMTRITLRGDGSNGFSGPLDTNAKSSRFGIASGPSATTPLAQADANVLLYANAAENWCGIGADGGGAFWVRTGLSGTPSASLILNTAGAPYLPYLPSASPGAGSKGLWFDPADGNRVKFAA